MVVEMNKFGAALGTRDAGRLAYTVIDQKIANGEMIEFDFSNVLVVTNSFADEVFGKLVDKSEFNLFK